MIRCNEAMQEMVHNFTDSKMSSPRIYVVTTQRNITECNQLQWVEEEEESKEEV